MWALKLICNKFLLHLSPSPYYWIYPLFNQTINQLCNPGASPCMTVLCRRGQQKQLVYLLKLFTFLILFMFLRSCTKWPEHLKSIIILTIEPFGRHLWAHCPVEPMREFPLQCGLTWAAVMDIQHKISFSQPERTSPLT